MAISAGRFVSKAMFATITNANFDSERINKLILESIDIVSGMAKEGGLAGGTHKPLSERDTTRFLETASIVGVMSQPDEDARSLQQLLIYGIKGISAYTHHAEMLGFEEPKIYRFILSALASTLKNISTEERTSLVLKTGECAVWAMELLDRANTETYGTPKITKVALGVRSRPGILISGHDLHDLKDLLDQTKDQGIDIYTHSEMLPAHYYPELKKYENLVGNYGGSWWHQDKDFESFNGPILMTTNCIVPVKDSYKDRIFTTGMAGYPGVKHIADRPEKGEKDFSEIIALAKKCPPPTQLETGEITGGFSHRQTLALADKIIEAVRSGAIKRFVVMGGCDGRQKERGYFTEVAEKLPKDAVILTAGCAKYRYIKLPLGDIGGIPRVLDAGQCNDSYSLALIALALKNAFGLDDVNKLPLSFDIAWYEQKAVAVLLALLHLGFKNIRLGPTLPAFLSPNIVSVLVKTFDIKPTSTSDGDVASMMSGN
jgi:hydroxylamine reductase